jgi:hypothetical protein
VGGEEESRCGESGWTLHAGATLHLRALPAWRRPYVSFGAGAAQVIEAAQPSGDVRPSIAGEMGMDFGGTHPLVFRLGVRWQGRPSVGTDYLGPVLGVRLRLH